MFIILAIMPTSQSIKVVWFPLVEQHMYIRWDTSSGKSPNNYCGEITIILGICLGQFVQFIHFRFIFLIQIIIALLLYICLIQC